MIWQKAEREIKARFMDKYNENCRVFQLEAEDLKEQHRGLVRETWSAHEVIRKQADMLIK